MNKQEFLIALEKSLADIPGEDREKSIEYYSESIDDRMEDGFSEEEAVEAVGSIREITAQIMLEQPLPKLVKARVKSGRTLGVWEIVLLILGAPLWLPLVAAALIILLSVYIVIWSVVLSLYSVDIALAASALAGVIGSALMLGLGNFAQAGLMLGAGLAAAGLAILLFFLFKLITKGILLLSKKIWRAVKSCFIRKEKVQ